MRLVHDTMYLGSAPHSGSKDLILLACIDVFMDTSVAEGVDDCYESYGGYGANVDLPSTLSWSNLI
jgi:hypothetical protein